jgi:hypothetical protein
VAAVTAGAATGPQGDGMRVAVVSRDPGIREQAAKAFDAAPISWSVTVHEGVPDDADVVVVGSDVDGPPDAIVFDPAAPHRVVRDITARAQHRGIVVTSPGGGTGVTTLAVHLASELARRGSACLVDLDTKWGAAARLGVPEDVKTWADVDDSQESLLLSAIPCFGFRALFAPRSSTPAAAKRVVRRAAAAFDRVVFDTPNTDLLDAALRSARIAVLVLAPTVPNARRARAMIETHPSMRWAIVANRLGPGSETTSGELQQVMGRSIAIELPCTPGLRDAEDDARLLASRVSRWSRRVARLAVALEQE